MTRPAPISYRIVPLHPEAHLFEITLWIAEPDAKGQRLSLPVWIPGSYLVREFARHVVSIRARNGSGRAVTLQKVDKNTWRAAPTGGGLEVTYQVYAWDLSVRAAHLDQTHAFFNGPCVFLRVVGQENRPHALEIALPPGAGYEDWQVATTLPTAPGQRPGKAGHYRAADYDELMDHPVEMGRFRLLSFKAHGVRHDMAITGHVAHVDTERLIQDCRALCERQIRLFEPKTLAAPFKRYLFLLQVVGDGYGGLEHRSSSSLIARRDSLPSPQTQPGDESYRRLLGLISHEYFHSWNVKRIKPAAFVPYDFDRENYTHLLWLFEGFTSYYDDLVLVRAGLFEQDAYFKELARVINTVEGTAAARRQSLSESSFDAWIKYYRQDENSPNAVVSYYNKGSLVALCLDLTIRERTRGRRSLDDVMRLLWRRFGRDFYDTKGQAVGLNEDGLAAILQEATGLDLEADLRAWTEEREPLPLDQRLRSHGCRLVLKSEPVATGPGRKRKAKPAASLGIRLSSEDNGLRIATVLDDGSAQKAGLAAGDVLVALDGVRLTGGTLQSWLKRCAVGERVTIHAFRQDALRTFEVELLPDPGLACRIETLPGKNPLRKAWLS